MNKATSTIRPGIKGHLLRRQWAATLMFLFLTSGTVCQAASESPGDEAAQRAIDSARQKPNAELSTPVPSATWSGPGVMEKAILAKDPRKLEALQKGLISEQLDKAARIIAVSGLGGKSLSEAIVDAGLIFTMPARYPGTKVTREFFEQSPDDPTQCRFVYHDAGWSRPLEFDFGNAYARWVADPSVQNNYQDGENLRLKLAEQVKLGIIHKEAAAGQFVAESNQLDEVRSLAVMQSLMSLTMLYASAHGELPVIATDLMAYADCRLLPESMAGGVLPIMITVDESRQSLKFTYQTRLGYPYVEAFRLNLVGSPSQFELRSLPLTELEAAGAANFIHTLLDTSSPRTES